MMYQKTLKYDGTSWKAPVPVTVPQVVINTANTDTTIFTPNSGFAVLNIILANPGSAAANVTIKDGSTTLLTVSVPAGGTVTLNGIVIRNSLVVNAAAAGVTVFATGEDYYSLIF